MAKQYRIQRKIATISVTAGGFATIDLPRSYDYETLFLRLSGTANVTAGATSVRAEAPCQWVPRVTVVADGKNNLFNAPFWYASLGSYDRSLLESGARATTPPSGVAIAAYAVEAIATIDFATVDGVRSKDSNFRTSGLSLFQLQVTFGNPGDIFVGGTVSFTGTPTIDVFSSELVEVPDDKTGAITTPIALKKISYQELAFTSSNANMEVRLPAGNQIRSVVVRGEGFTTAGEPQTTVLNNIQLVSGVDVRFNLAAANVRAKNNADYGQLTAGYYVADVCAVANRSVQLSELWDVSGQTEPKLILDVNGSATTKVQAVVTEYILGGK